MRPPVRLNRTPLNQPVPPPLVQGDPATHRFAVVLLGTLAIVTIGSLVGILAGNAAHYEYYGPNNKTTISAANLSSSVLFGRYIGEDPRLWLSLNERLEELDSSRQTRQSRSANEKSSEKRRQ